MAALKTADVNSGRMVLRVEQGKGRKDRYAILSPLMLERLRMWWRYTRSKNQVIDGGFLGQDRVNPMTMCQLNRGSPPAVSSLGGCSTVRTPPSVPTSPRRPTLARWRPLTLHTYGHST